MNELQEKIWFEKYRPSNFDELILENKSLLLGFLGKPLSIPSFIFYSVRPGTGKTSTAKLMMKHLDCDDLSLNSSEERGIDTIRDKITSFVRSLSSNPNSKRCVHLDEADGLTKAAQDSLRNLMEEYSDNCFFIFTANELDKIIDPIQSRCVLVNFDNPSKTSIMARLEDVAVKEDINTEKFDIEKLVDMFYPDMRRMINSMQEYKITGTASGVEINLYRQFFELLQNKRIKDMYDMVYSGTLNILGFNKWFFHFTYNEISKVDINKSSWIALRLADVEKSAKLGANLEIVFLANMMEIMNVL